MRSSGPIGPERAHRCRSPVELTYAHILPWSVATIRYATLPPLRRKRASLSPPRFRPRVLANFRHFSQKSALKRAKIHALLWAYRGPRAMDAGTQAHMQAYALEPRDYPLRDSPPAPQEKSFALTSPIPSESFSQF